GGRHNEPGPLWPEPFVFPVEPESPADQIGLRRGDQILTLDGAPLAHWDLLRQRLAHHPQGTSKVGWISPGGVRREASFRPEVRSELDAYRQEEQRLVFGALNRLA